MLIQLFRVTERDAMSKWSVIDNLMLCTMKFYRDSMELTFCMHIPICLYAWNGLYECI